MSRIVAVLRPVDRVSLGRYPSTWRLSLSSHLVQKLRRHEILNQPSMRLELRVHRLHRNMVVRNQATEDIPERVASVELFRASQQDVVALARICDHDPWLGERLDEDLEDRGAHLLGLQREPA